MRSVPRQRPINLEYICNNLRAPHLCARAAHQLFISRINYGEREPERVPASNLNITIIYALHYKLSVQAHQRTRHAGAV